ncbi:MAG: hypothetical protein ACREDV_08890, partial [Methylocella sp.]
MKVGISKCALAVAAFGAVTLSAPVPARADTAAEIRELREKLRGFDDLKARLGRLEARAAKEAKAAKEANGHARPAAAPAHFTHGGPQGSAHPERLAVAAT